MSEQDPKPARIEIEGDDGIAIRQLVPEDAQRYFDLIEYDRAHLSRHDQDTAFKYPTLEKVQESIIPPAENPTRLRFGIWDGGIMVGSINLTPEEDGRAAEVGYWVGEQYIGHGYAAKAVRVLISYAFNQTDLERLFAKVNIKNIASRKTLKNAGFSQNKDEEWLFELERDQLNS